jgi:cysteine desulfurase
MAARLPETRIYLDYQASTPVDPEVAAAMVPYIFEHPGNPHADHAFGWEAGEGVSRAASDIASVIGCDSDELIFTSGATEANNLAFLGLVDRAPKGRTRILVSAVEHKCVIESARAAARRLGSAVEILPVDASGALSPGTLEEAMDERVLIVSAMTVNNEVGTLLPIAELGEIAHRFGALFHTDAAQALTAGPLDVSALNVDLLSLSGHKVYGPKGIGVLFAARDVQPQMQPIIYGGGQQSGLRSGTLPVPLCVGMGYAVKMFTAAAWPKKRVRVTALRDALAKGFLGLDPDFTLNGPPLEKRHPGNLNIRFTGHDAREILSTVQPMLAASTGSACTSGEPSASHVLRAIGLSEDDANASLRFGVGRFTTENDIVQAVSIIEDAIRKMRQ